MALFEWQNGTKVQNAVVTGDGVTVQDAVWEGETPLSASNLNAAQNNLIDYINTQIYTTLGIATDTWSLSSSYSVGDMVVYEKRIYKNLTGNNVAAPNIDTTNWRIVPVITNE